MFLFLFALQKLDSLLLDGDNLASPSSTLSLVSDASSGLKHRRSSSKLKDENSPVGFGAELSQVSLGYLSYIFYIGFRLLEVLCILLLKTNKFYGQGCFVIQGRMRPF